MLRRIKWAQKKGGENHSHARIECATGPRQQSPHSTEFSPVLKPRERLTALFAWLHFDLGRIDEAELIRRLSDVQRGLWERRGK